MTTLVTGGAGYIGSHTVYALLDRGEEVVVLDNLSTGKRWLLPDSVPFFLGDIGNATLVGSVIEAFGIDTIIHFAGSIVVPHSVKDPLGYYLNNTVNSQALIQAAVSGRVSNFIFSSTAAVYGEPIALPVTEDARTEPTSPYGSSKLMTEIMLRDAAAASQLRFVNLRYFNVAGADPGLRTGQSGDVATHIIKIASQAALGLRTHVDVYGDDYDTPDGTCLRDYIHVVDLAKAHCAALDYLREGGPNSTFNCGYGHGFSVRQVVEVVKAVSGVNFSVRRAGRRAGDPASLIAGVDRIRKALRWRPEFDNLPAIVTHALAWEGKLALVEARSVAPRRSVPVTNRATRDRAAGSRPLVELIATPSDGVAIGRG